MLNAQHLQNINNILTSSDENIEGNIYCDIKVDNIMPRSQEKIKNLSSFSKNANKICEIGFNAGHSALAMLNSNPNAEYVFFDLGFHKYTNLCFNYFKNAFPSTSLSIFYGDSKVSIRDYILKNISTFNSFDFIHLDGGHGLDTLSKDYAHSMFLLKSGGFLVVDDCNVPQIRDFLHVKSNSGYIKEVFGEPTDNRQRIFEKK